MKAGSHDGSGDNLLLKGEADDNGNAEAMYRLYGRELLFTEAFGWLSWTGTHWREIPEPTVAKMVIITLKRRRHAAVEAEVEAIVKATKADRSRVAGCLSLFKSYVIVEDVAAFDAEPDLLNCKNGVLDLRTGTLTPHSPTQRFTYCLPVDYDPAADDTEWRTFLMEVLGSDREVVDYMQLWAGYSLTGHTREEKMLYLFGPTRAGKGTTAETLLKLLPRPLSAEADFANLTGKRDPDSQNFDLAGLRQARLVVASESDKHQELNPAKIKLLTGGNYVRCAFKHKDMFTYRPQYKVWLVSNHKINSDPDDDAMWGRVQVITFPHSHLGAEDVTLKARLQTPANLRGVLRWCVEGARRWYDGARLIPPESVSQATTKQRDDQDYVKQWIEDCCLLDPDAWTPSAALMQSHQAWCEASNVKAHSANDLADALVKRFSCKPHRQPGTGKRGYTGIRAGVTPPSDPESGVTPDEPATDQDSLPFDLSGVTPVTPEKEVFPRVQGEIEKRGVWDVTGVTVSQVPYDQKWSFGKRVKWYQDHEGLGYIAANERVTAENKAAPKRAENSGPHQRGQKRTGFDVDDHDISDS